MKKVSKKKMMTGGMANSNAKVSVQTSPGSNGVKTNVNPKVTASPAKMGKGGSVKGKMGYGGMKKKAC